MAWRTPPRRGVRAIRRGRYCPAQRAARPLVEYEVDARLQLGQHELVVPTLRQLIAEDPLRERLRGQLGAGSLSVGTAGGGTARARCHPGPARRGARSGPRSRPPAPPSSSARAAAEPGVDTAVRLLISLMIGWAGPGRSPSARLPAPTTKLIGRQRELQSIQLALAENRMVTLSGPGGVGKSRLALAVAPMNRSIVGQCGSSSWPMSAMGGWSRSRSLVLWASSRRPIRSRR